MDVLVKPDPLDNLPVRPMGRNTAATIQTKPHWETLIAPAPHFFHGASDAVEVSPPLYHYCPGGLDNQTIGMCVGKGTKNGIGTVLRIPPNATFDPNDPATLPPRGPNVRLSGLFCYYNARNVHGNPGWGEGAVVAYSMDAVKTCGVIPESLWPDTDANQAAYADRRAPSPDDRAEGLKHLVVDCARITTRQQYLDYLAMGFPVIDGVDIGSGWMRTADDGAFSLGGRTVGGHCTETCGYDRKLNRLYKRNSWLGWGARTDDPEFNSDDPALGGNAGGHNNIGYCPLDQYESVNLNDAALGSGQTDAFVVLKINGFAAPVILPVHSQR